LGYTRLNRAQSAATHTTRLAFVHGSAISPRKEWLSRA
jgi:hypothetical protein